MKTALLVCLLILLHFPALPQEIEYNPVAIYGQLLSDPHDLYIDSNGDMYVADSYHTRVFDNTGKFKRDYSYPMVDDRSAITKSNVNVAKDHQGNFYILGKNNLVRKIDKEGNILLSFGKVENVPWNVEYTSGIAIDQEGYIYVSDTYHNHIVKYNQHGLKVKTIGSAGSGLGQFNSPSQILIDQTGNLLVTDSKNGRIQIFTSSGEFLRKIGQAENNGAPMYPVDLALDVAGNIYVADTMSYMIRKFDPNGKFMKDIGAKGPDNGKFLTPNLKVALDNSGNIYVVENLRNRFLKSRIQKFNNQGNYVSTVVDNLSTNDYVLVASDQEGNFVSANYGTGLIKKFDTNGEFMLSFNNREDTPAGYTGTVKDIATDKQGNIYVLDNSKYGSVKMYTPYGQLIRRFAPDYESSRESSYDHSIPYEPYKLAFDTEGNIYIGDILHKIFKYNARGELLKKIKMFNPVTGDSIKFDINTSFDISKQNELYVISKSGIQKFDLDGNYIGDFTPSDIQTYYGEATEIDFDQEGNIYIIEFGYIKRYNYEGILLSTSSYNSSLVNQGIYSNVSVNRNGTRIVVSTYNKASVFVSSTRSDNYTSVKNFISGSVYDDKKQKLHQRSRRKRVGWYCNRSYSGTLLWCVRHIR